MARRRARREGARAATAPAAAGPAPPSARAVLAVLLLAALAVKGIVLAQLAHHPLLQPTGGLDSEAYVRLAERAAAGDWALGPDVYFVSPLYVYFLALVRVLGGSLLVARVLQVILGAAGVGLLWWAARERFGTGVAHGAAVLALATGVITFNEVLLLQSALDPFLTALGLALLARALRAGTWPAFALTGAAVGLHVLNRPNVLAWLAALAVLLALFPGRRRGALLVVAGAALVMAPVAVRNRVVAGEWVLVSSHGGLNFYIGNNPQADGTYRSVPGITPSIEGQAKDARRVAEAAEGRRLTTSEASSYFYRRAGDWIRASPGAALRLFARKLALVFNAADLSLNYSYRYYSADEPTLLRALVVGPGLLVPLGLFGLALARPRAGGAAERWIWPAFVPVYAVSVALFFVSSRYRLPLLLPLAVGAAAGLARILEDVRARRARPLAWGAAAVALLAVAANWDFGLDEGRAAERTERIVQLVDAGDLAAARALLARTEPTHPDPAVLHFRVGTALAERGQAAEAVGPLEKAAREAPGTPAIALALAQALAAAGREREAGAALDGVPPETAADADTAVALGALGLRGRNLPRARAFLERARALDPGSATARLDLAVVLAEQGLYAEARQEAEEALRLRPDYPQARALRDELDELRHAAPQGPDR